MEAMEKMYFIFLRRKRMRERERTLYPAKCICTCKCRNEHRRMKGTNRKRRRLCTHHGMAVLFVWLVLLLLFVSESDAIITPVQEFH